MANQWIVRFLACAFALCSLLAWILPDPADCYALAKRVGNQFLITCNISAECEEEGGLCDYTTAQVGSNYYHGCHCDASGRHAKGDGYMSSGNSDPSAPGRELFCYQEQDPCLPHEVCDENQMCGEWFRRLCECKSP